MKKTIFFSLFLVFFCFGFFCFGRLCKDIRVDCILCALSLIIAQHFFRFIISIDLGGLVDKNNPPDRFPLKISRIAFAVLNTGIVVSMILVIYIIGIHFTGKATDIHLLLVTNRILSGITIGAPILILFLIFIFIDLAERESRRYHPANSI